MKETLTRTEAIARIRQTGGSIFGCTFTKRTTGETRSGSWRLGVSKGVSGKGLRFDPAAKRLIPVYDMRSGFRMIPFEGIQTVTIGGVKYVVVDG